MESIQPHRFHDPANPFEQPIPLWTPSETEYQYEMMERNADITEKDIKMALGRTDIDQEEREYWLKKLTEDFSRDEKIADKLRFFALVSKMTREEKIQLYVFGKKFYVIPGIHDIRSHFIVYFSLFPNDNDWVAEAKKQLN